MPSTDRLHDGPTERYNNNNNNAVVWSLCDDDDDDDDDHFAANDGTAVAPRSVQS